MASETTTEVDQTTPRKPVARLRDALEGPNTLGNSRSFWAGFFALLGILAVYPMFRSSFQVSNTAQLLLSAFLGLSLCIIWGYAGIFSFGQVAFYGLAGYTFGVVGINLANPMGTVAGLFVGVFLAGVFAFLLGYFMFYGGVSDVYVAIITLAVALALNTFAAQTAGDEWSIGEAALGGFNGMTGIPNLSLGVSDTAIALSGVSFYYFIVISLTITYLALRVLVNGKIGYALVAIRENEQRTELFGYDTKRIKLGVFTLGGVLAGLGGVTYASWGNFVDPSVFGITFAALPIIWVAAGGRKWLSGAIIGTFVIEYVSQWLSSNASGFSQIVLGLLLLIVVLSLPEGFVPQIHRRIVRFMNRNTEEFT